MGNKNSEPLSGRLRSLGSTGTMDEDEVQNLSYFYSELSRKQAEDVMRRHAKDPGSFLLRFSSEHDRYAITVVAARNLIGHTMIFSQHNRNYYVVEDIQFESMPALIDYYTSHPLPNIKDATIEAKLRTPIYKFRKPISNPDDEPPVPQQQNEWRGSAVYESIRSRQPGNVHFTDFGEVVSLPHPPFPPRLLSSQTPRKPMLFSRTQRPDIGQGEYLTPNNYDSTYVMADDATRERYPSTASDDITRVKELLRSEVRHYSFGCTEPLQLGQNGDEITFTKFGLRSEGILRDGSCSDLYMTMRPFQH